MIGAVTMKMTRRTNMTSTSGVTLICAIVVPSRWEEASIAMSTSVDLFKKVALGDVQKLMGKIIHLHRQHFYLLHEVIIRHQRGNGSSQAHRRRDQCLGDTRRHGLDA